MGFFKNSGATFDGQAASSTSKGIIGAPIIWRPKSNDEIVYKYPFDNLKNGALVVVHQTQQAYLYLNGVYTQTIPPTGEPYQLTTANIPLLGKFLNLPTGGATANTAEIWFVNIETEREALWGVGEIPIFDPRMNSEFIIGAHGGYNLRINDAELFIQKLVGTLHQFTTGDVLKYFNKRISSIISQNLSLTIDKKQLSLLQLQHYRSEIEQAIEQSINLVLAEYGVFIKNYAIENFNIPDEYRKIIVAQTQGTAENRRLAQLGINYTKERQLDILQEAAGNEGAGNIMGAGMGLGMGVGIGNAMSETVSQTFPGNNMVPPPLTQETPFYFALNGQQSGPHHFSEIQALIDKRLITRDTLYWQQGMASWQPVSSNAGLSTLIATPPPIF